MSSTAIRLREARSAAGYKSGKAAAEAQGWTISTYLSHEKGARGLSVAKAKAYGEAYGVDPSFLLYGDQSGPTNGDIRAAAVGEVRDLIYQSGLSIEALSERTGIHKTTLFRAKSGNGGFVPSGTTMAKLRGFVGRDDSSEAGRALSPPQVPIAVRATDGGVQLSLHVTVSAGVAAKILALIEEENA